MAYKMENEIHVSRFMSQENESQHSSWPPLVNREVRQCLGNGPCKTSMPVNHTQFCLFLAQCQGLVVVVKTKHDRYSINQGPKITTLFSIEINENVLQELDLYI